MSEAIDKMLDRLIAMTDKHARNVLIDRGEDLVPTWALIGADKSLQVIPTPWADNQEKQIAIVMMKTFMRLTKTVVYSFVTEAWLAKMSEKEFDNPMGVVSPSQRVDRQEVVIACAATADDVKWARWNIERNDAGKVTGLVSQPLKLTDEDAQIESWIGGMLK